ncbi:hypothetical protein MT418_004106 [Batrachochytrium dendrobatidis]
MDKVVSVNSSGDRMFLSSAIYHDELVAGYSIDHPHPKEVIKYACYPVLSVMYFYVQTVNHLSNATEQDEATILYMLHFENFVYLPELCAIATQKWRQDNPTASFEIRIITSGIMETSYVQEAISRLNKPMLLFPNLNQHVVVISSIL